MQERLKGQDASAIYIKGLAAAAKGIQFPGTSRTSEVRLVDANGLGVYSGVVANTTTADTYKFVIEAVGQTPDGQFFRRESHEQVRVRVKPDASSTLVDLQLLPPSSATANVLVRVFPRDRFGNVVLLDPADKGSIALTTTAGEFTSGITTTFDGSYAQTLSYPQGTTPAIGLIIRGNVVVPGSPIPPIEALVWADYVVSYHEGGQAAPGANQHTDPHDALGDPLKKPADRFVSLGASGSLVVGPSGKDVLASGADDVVVVVQPDFDLRAYRVEAEDAHMPGRWIVLGESPGVTRGFRLRAGGLRAASAIRITDRSGRTRDESLKPLATPGVSIRGVGFRQTGYDPTPPPTGGCDCLEAFCKALHKLCP